MEDDRLMRLQEAADYSGMSVRTLRSWIESGRLPALRFGPRQLRIRKSALDAMGTPVEPKADEG